jgi:recombination protein RecA
MKQKDQQFDRGKSLEITMAQIEKEYGKGAIMRMGERKVAQEVSVIPTGSLSLDMAIGIGGVPRGRSVEIYGPESSGKTTLTLHIIAEAQKKKGLAAFIDAEHALDPSYAGKLGVDIDNLLISQPDYGEQALEITDMLVKSGAIDVIVIDSVAALVPKAEIEGEMGDAFVGLQARLMSQAMRKLTGTINRSKTCVIFTNQIREKIGVMFGNPTTTPGGRALKFYSSVRLEIRRVSSIMNGTDIVGNRTHVKVVKNKLAPPFRTCEFDIIFNEGISRLGDVLDIGVKTGLVSKSGSWYSYKDERIGQGRDNCVQFLKDNSDIANEIEAGIKTHYGFAVTGEPAQSETGK